MKLWLEQETSSAIQLRWEGTDEVHWIIFCLDTRHRKDRGKCNYEPISPGTNSFPLAENIKYMVDRVKRECANESWHTTGVLDFKVALLPKLLAKMPLEGQKPIAREPHTTDLTTITDWCTISVDPANWGHPRQEMEVVVGSVGNLQSTQTINPLVDNQDKHVQVIEIQSTTTGHALAMAKTTKETQIMETTKSTLNGTALEVTNLSADVTDVSLKLLIAGGGVVKESWSCTKAGIMKTADGTLTVRDVFKTIMTDGLRTLPVITTEQKLVLEITPSTGGKYQASMTIDISGAEVLKLLGAQAPTVPATPPTPPPAPADPKKVLLDEQEQKINNIRTDLNKVLPPNKKHDPEMIERMMVALTMEIPRALRTVQGDRSIQLSNEVAILLARVEAIKVKEADKWIAITEMVRDLLGMLDEISKLQNSPETGFDSELVEIRAKLADRNLPNMAALYKFSDRVSDLLKRVQKKLDDVRIKAEKDRVAGIEAENKKLAEDLGLQRQTAGEQKRKADQADSDKKAAEAKAAKLLEELAKKEEEAAQTPKTRGSLKSILWTVLITAALVVTGFFLYNKHWVNSSHTAPPLDNVTSTDTNAVAGKNSMPEGAAAETNVPPGYTAPPPRMASTNMDDITREQGVVIQGLQNRLDHLADTISKSGILNAPTSVGNTTNSTGSAAVHKDISSSGAAGKTDNANGVPSGGSSDVLMGTGINKINIPIIINNNMPPMQQAPQRPKSKGDRAESRCLKHANISLAHSDDTGSSGCWLCSSETTKRIDIGADDGARPGDTKDWSTPISSDDIVQINIAQHSTVAFGLSTASAFDVYLYVNGDYVLWAPSLDRTWSDADISHARVRLKPGHDSETLYLRATRKA